MTTSVKTRVVQFLSYAKKKISELNSEEAKFRAEKYRLQRQVEQAKIAYLKTKHARQQAEKSTGGDSFISKADKVLSSMFGSGSSKKKSAPKRKPTKKKDDWNFWD